jgi:hypothetical protein
LECCVLQNKFILQIAVFNFYKESIMKKFLVSLFALLALTVNASFAADKGFDQNIVIDNARVRVTVVTWQPGAESPRVARELDRVVHAEKGGSIVRNYEDGRQVKYTYKTGDIVYADSPDDKLPYSIKNIGKSKLVLQVTFLK